VLSASDFQFDSFGEDIVFYVNFDVVYPTFVLNTAI